MPRPDALAFLILWQPIASWLNFPMRHRRKYRLPARRHSLWFGFRWLLARVGLGFFADEANLNLLSRNDLADLATGSQGYDVDVLSVALLGWPSNLLLVGRRRDAAASG